MITFTKVTLSAAFLVAVVGSAYAADPQQPNQPAAGQQLSYTPGAPQPEAAPAASNPDHFVKPPGYDQNRQMYPYGPGYGPKAN